jgi:hypothetical protein
LPRSAGVFVLEPGPPIGLTTFAMTATFGPTIGRRSAAVSPGTPGLFPAARRARSAGGLQQAEILLGRPVARQALVLALSDTSAVLGAIRTIAAVAVLFTRVRAAAGSRAGRARTRLNAALSVGERRHWCEGDCGAFPLAHRRPMLPLPPAPQTGSDRPDRPSAT